MLLESARSFMVPRPAHKRKEAFQCSSILSRNLEMTCFASESDIASFLEESFGPLAWHSLPSQHLDLVGNDFRGQIHDSLSRGKMGLALRFHSPGIPRQVFRAGFHRLLALTIFDPSVVSIDIVTREGRIGLCFPAEPIPSAHYKLRFS